MIREDGGFQRSNVLLSPLSAVSEINEPQNLASYPPCFISSPLHLFKCDT
jgi:hypothetical protein